MESIDSIKVDRKAIKIGRVGEPPDEKSYWLSKTPDEGLEAVELMREIIYGCKITDRLQRILEITQRPKVS